ncbi:hypothetical protein ISCGN_027315 [Ixodes scapularis]
MRGKTGPTSKLSPRRNMHTQREPSVRRPARRSVATWTSQEGLEAPRAYFSGHRWAEQRRVPAAAQGAQVPLVFRGRTIRETDLAAGGAAAADNPGSRFCRGCGGLFLHPIHLKSEAHRARVGRLQAVCDPPPQPRGDAAALVVGRMEWDGAFADAIRAALVRAPVAGAAALPAAPPPLPGALPPGPVGPAEPAAPPPGQGADVAGLLDDFLGGMDIHLAAKWVQLKLSQKESRCSSFGRFALAEEIPGFLICSMEGLNEAQLVLVASLCSHLIYAGSIAGPHFSIFLNAGASNSSLYVSQRASELVTAGLPATIDLINKHNLTGIELVFVPTDPTNLVTKASTTGADLVKQKGPAALIVRSRAGLPVVITTALANVLMTHAETTRPLSAVAFLNNFNRTDPGQPQAGFRYFSCNTRRPLRLVCLWRRQKWSLYFLFMTSLSVMLLPAPILAATRAAVVGRGRRLLYCRSLIGSTVHGNLSSQESERRDTRNR